MTLGERIKAYREDGGLTLRQLAGELGMSVTYLNDLELGIRSPRRGMSDQTLGRFAKLFDLSIERLRQEMTAPRITQISAAWTGQEVRVACLYSDGSVVMQYPEREES